LVMPIVKFSNNKTAMVKGWTRVGSKLHNVVQNLTIRSYPLSDKSQTRGSLCSTPCSMCVMKLEKFLLIIHYLSNDSSLPTTLPSLVLKRFFIMFHYLPTYLPTYHELW
jgi:hypothetical protein